jgi:hypothetical protein
MCELTSDRNNKRRDFREMDFEHDSVVAVAHATIDRVMELALG